MLSLKKKPYSKMKSTREIREVYSLSELIHEGIIRYYEAWIELLTPQQLIIQNQFLQKSTG